MSRFFCSTNWNHDQLCPLWKWFQSKVPRWAAKTFTNHARSHKNSFQVRRYTKRWLRKQPSWLCPWSGRSGQNWVPWDHFSTKSGLPDFHVYVVTAKSNLMNVRPAYCWKKISNNGEKYKCACWHNTLGRKNMVLIMSPKCPAYQNTLAFKQ